MIKLHISLLYIKYCYSTSVELRRLKQGSAFKELTIIKEIYRGNLNSNSKNAVGAERREGLSEGQWVFQKKGKACAKAQGCVEHANSRTASNSG